MNTVQRKFIIEKIQSEVKKKIEELRKTKLEHPSAANFIFKAILTDQLKLQPEAKILEAIKNKALAAKEGRNWLSEEGMGVNRETTIQLLIEQLIIIPEDYKIEKERVIAFNTEIYNKIKELEIHLNTIEMRVQLASDKTLQNLVNEVDDFGSISLVDTKLKLLSSGAQ